MTDLIQAIMDKGFNRTDAQMINELSKHASLEGLATIGRIAESAPTHVRDTILINAMLSLMVASIDMCNELGMSKEHFLKFIEDHYHD